MYPSDQTKVGLVVSLLTGEVFNWSSPVGAEQSSDLQMGQGPVTSYTAHFQCLVGDVKWNEAVRLCQFQWELSENVKDELACVENPSA